jgi:hypothetical protein
MAIPDDPLLVRLRAGLIDISRQPWLATAANLGWDEVAVFGINLHAPLVRIECQGIAVHLAISPHNRMCGTGQMLRCRLMSIDNNRAITDTPTGARFTHDRFAHGFTYAAPVWELPEFRCATKH